MFFFFKRDPKFQILPSTSEDDSDIESEELLTSGKYARRATTIPKGWIYLTVVNLTILGINLSLIFCLRWWPLQRKNAALKQFSYWSPILDDVEIPTYTTMINGTFFAKPEVSIAREEPGPENDAAWHQYEKVLTHVVTREEIIKLGKDPDTVARFDDHYWGLGNDAYMVQMDVMHQIHCLNLLRKAAFADYPGYSPELDPYDKMWWIHLGHCTDILLQNIQCNANTEMLTLAWVEDRHAPWPDFSVNRKCRDFNTLATWQREHAVDADKYDRMPLPKDAFVWPSPWKKQDLELGVELGKSHLQEGLSNHDMHDHSKK